MKIKKRDIIREGLILLALMLVIMAYYLFINLPDTPLFNEIIPACILLLYPIYLYIRFISWVAKRNKVDVAQAKIRWYNSPKFIYCVALLLTIFVLPLLWITPFTTKNRKMLFSSIMLLCVVMNFTKNMSFWSLAYGLTAVVWFYNTEKYQKPKG